MDATPRQSRETAREPTAARGAQASASRGGVDMPAHGAFIDGIHRGPVLTAQRRAVAAIVHSPRMVAQRERAGTEDTRAQASPEAMQGLLKALSAAREAKPEAVTGAAEGEWDAAVGDIEQIVRSGDEQALSEVLEDLKTERDQQEDVASVPGGEKGAAGEVAVQFSGWRFAGAIVGGLLGTLLCPVIGTYLLGRKGWELGKHRDDVNRLYAAGATVAEVNAMMLIEPDPVTLLAQIQAEVAQNPTCLHQLYLDGATSAQITALLALHANGATLHAQIQAEAAQSPTRLHQLYLDGATSVEITALLGQEPDGTTLHAQIQAEATHSPTRLRRLYLDGATSIEITALLGREPDGATLHAQIQAEAAQSPTRLHQLYLDGATSVEITALLGQEPDGTTLHAQIQAEATHSPTRLRRLYLDGATSVEITALLGREPDGATLHAQIQAEAAQSPARLNRLYVDGLTSAQITTLLGHEPDGGVLHAQILAEATQGAALVHQLYVTDGATSAQITALLALEPDGAVLHTQIQNEVAHSVMLVHQLYVVDLATSAQITSMLAAEPDGATLHANWPWIRRQDQDGVTINPLMMTRIARQRGTANTLGGIQAGNAGQSLAWSQQNVNLNGTAFGNWLLNGGPQPNVNNGNMNCWEVVLFGAFTAGYVGLPWLQAFYQGMQASLQGENRLTLMNNQYYENRLGVGNSHVYNPLMAGSPRPLEGDIVVFGRAVQHTALALGNTAGSPQVYSLWNQPNANLFLQRTTVAALLAVGPATVRFFSPNWM